MTPRVLVMAASLRRGSLNRRLAAAMAAALAEAGADVDHLDMADFRVPVYDGDLEDAEGVPQAARDLGDRMRAAAGFVIVSPEYNGGTPGPLKNLIDWISRPVGEVSGSSAFRDKLVMLLSASPGAIGGLRGLAHTRATFSHLGSVVLPNQYALGNADRAFDSSGRLIDESARKRVQSLAARWVAAAGRWAA